MKDLIPSTGKGMVLNGTPRGLGTWRPRDLPHWSQVSPIPAAVEQDLFSAAEPRE